DMDVPQLPTEQDPHQAVQEVAIPDQHAPDWGPLGIVRGHAPEVDAGEALAEGTTADDQSGSEGIVRRGHGSDLDPEISSSGVTRPETEALQPHFPALASHDHERAHLRIAGTQTETAQGDALHPDQLNHVGPVRGRLNGRPTGRLEGDAAVRFRTGDDDRL